MSGKKNIIEITVPETKFEQVSETLSDDKIEFRYEIKDDEVIIQTFVGSEEDVESVNTIVRLFEGGIT